MTREEAYDMIDRYLRAVMHDRDYADYSAALDVILTPPPAPRVVVTEAMVEAMSRHVYQYALTTHADIRAGLTAALTEAPADGA